MKKIWILFVLTLISSSAVASELGYKCTYILGKEAFSLTHPTSIEQVATDCTSQVWQLLTSKKVTKVDSAQVIMDGKYNGPIIDCDELSGHVKIRPKKTVLGTTALDESLWDYLSMIKTGWIREYSQYGRCYDHHVLVNDATYDSSVTLDGKSLRLLIMIGIDYPPPPAVVVPGM
ncbi:MAG: hypothetical protein IT286_04505 [Proteobacteria bacterium]|jgi:hypothetical protein|nr:hypothetical protein [Pseudomonadota bacterium]